MKREAIQCLSVAYRKKKDTPQLHLLCVKHSNNHPSSNMGPCLNHRITVSPKPLQWLTTILCLLLLTTISEHDYTFSRADFQEKKKKIFRKMLN